MARRWIITEGDHEGRRPAVDGADEPAERQLGHDPADAVGGPLEGRLVVEGQHDAGDDLDEEEEEDRASRVIPERVPVLGDFLLGQVLEDGRERQAVVEPGRDAFSGRSSCFALPRPACGRRGLRPRPPSSRRRSGLGGGPATFARSRRTSRRGRRRRTASSRGATRRCSRGGCRRRPRR